MNAQQVITKTHCIKVDEAEQALILPCKGEQQFLVWYQVWRTIIRR